MRFSVIHTSSRGCKCSRDIFWRRSKLENGVRDPETQGSKTCFKTDLITQFVNTSKLGTVPTVPCLFQYIEVFFLRRRKKFRWAQVFSYSISGYTVLKNELGTLSSVPSPSCHQQLAFRAGAENQPEARGFLRPLLTHRHRLPTGSNPRQTRAGYIQRLPR